MDDERRRRSFFSVSVIVGAVVVVDVGREMDVEALSSGSDADVDAIALDVASLLGGRRANNRSKMKRTVGLLGLSLGNASTYGPASIVPSCAETKPLGVAL